MKPINQELLASFFEMAADRLKGEWILIGGSVLPSLGRDIRSTVDIDLASKSGKGGSKQLELMEIADELGLPIEAINTAGEFFLRKIKDFEEHLIPLFSKKGFKIYRPDLELFIRLKIARLNESDLQDCTEFIRLAVEKSEPFNASKIKAFIDKEIKLGDSRLARLTRLRAELP